MKGINLRSLSGDLYKVAPEHDECPASAIENVDEKLGERGRRIAAAYAVMPGEHDFTFKTDYHHLPLTGFDGFSFDELCKLHFSTTFCMHESVELLFRDNPRYRVPWKIRNSMHHLCSGRGRWSDLVDAYNCIRRFTFDLNPDVELRLDYTTSGHPRGRSTFSRTFIDGVFAYLVYHKREHVMTIGFSVAAGRKILIQQIQSPKCFGNRYLYTLAGNRLDFVLERFMECFSGYSVYLVDGEDLVGKALSEYRRGLDCAEDSLHRGAFMEKLAHLRADKDRIVAFYRNVERFKFGTEVFESNGWRHHLILPRTQVSACFCE